ncbi:hypothetical protein NKG94_49150 [Micromonospora sp. M12]
MQVPTEGLLADQETSLALASTIAPMVEATASNVVPTSSHQIVGVAQSFLSSLPSRRFT